MVFRYALDRLSAKQPAEETSDRAANHRSWRAEYGPQGGTGNLIEMAHRAVDLVEFLAGEQRRRCQCMICGVRRDFAPSFCVDVGRV
jgi:hypothetical protein